MPVDDTVLGLWKALSQRDWDAVKTFLSPDCIRSEEHTSELQSRRDLVCRLLLEKKKPEEDFNSYATHRGDHLTAMRATFANPTLKNEMVRNPDGSVKAGSLARIEPEGRVVRMWEAIETYIELLYFIIATATEIYTLSLHDALPI